MKSNANIDLIILIMGIVLLFMNSCRKEENKPPISQIVSPTNGSEFEQEDIVTISVEADDKDGSITVVRFYINDAFAGTSKTKPYTYKWDTTDKTIGNHLIKIIAVDNEGSSTSHSESSAGYAYLDHNYSESGSNFTDLQMGLSVRCIKDN